VPPEQSPDVKFEIGHVLFIDIVGYSKLVINEQRALLDRLNRIVRCTEQFQRAEQASRLIKIPTGDGMALVFYNSPEAPVECALETSCATRPRRRAGDALPGKSAAHRGDGKRFVMRADEKLTAFVELESAICVAERPEDGGAREITLDKCRG